MASTLVRNAQAILKAVLILGSEKPERRFKSP